MCILQNFTSQGVKIYLCKAIALQSCIEYNTSIFTPCDITCISCIIFQYQCYVSECNAKFENPAERRNHCITVHKFPKNFRYDCEGRKFHKPESKDAMIVEETECPKPRSKKTVVHLGKNQKMKMFQHNQSLCERAIQEMTTMSMEDSGSPKSTETLSVNSTDIVPSSQPVPVKSALTFIPRQVSQKSYSKLLTKNKNMEQNILETETMMELAESLPV